MTVSRIQGSILGTRIRIPLLLIPAAEAEIQPTIAAAAMKISRTASFGVLATKSPMPSSSFVVVEF